MDKRVKIVTERYNNYLEDERLKKDAGIFEFVTSMKYINKYAKPGMKILELGAGTGAYSVELAKQGYNVTALELVKSNLKILKQNGKGLKNLNAVQGDALDLSRFEDNSFDMVLSFGPMYHFYTQADKEQAVKEAVRVCKAGGIIMFAYISHSSIVWDYGVRKKCIENLQYALLPDGAIRDIPEEVYSSFFVEEFHKLMKSTGTKFLKDVATDGLAHIMKEYLTEMTEEQNKMMLDYHLLTCERKDMLGYSSHLLYICKKI